MGPPWIRSKARTLSLEDPPDHEVPRGSMPEPAQHHDRQ